MSEYKAQPLHSVFQVRRIVTVHYFEFDRRFHSHRESHNFWEMVYLDKGRIAALAGEQRLLLQQGDCLFYAPDVAHELVADGDSAPNVFIISFVCNSRAMQAFTGCLLHLPPACRRYIAEIIAEAEQAWVLPFNDPSLKELTVDPAAPAGAQQMVRTNLEQLLIRLLRERTGGAHAAGRLQNEMLKKHDNLPAFSTVPQFNKPQKSAEGPAVARTLMIPAAAQTEDSPLVNRVRRLLEEHLYEKYTVEQVCRTLNFSRAYLSRVFLARTGQTMARYFRRLKIDEARRLIRAGDENLDQISDRLGFENSHTFSRTFRAVTGMSPTEYRRSIRL